MWMLSNVIYIPTVSKDSIAGAALNASATLHQRPNLNMSLVQSHMQDPTNCGTETKISVN